MNEIRVGSWNELSDALYAESWQAGLGRFRSTLAYRGMANAGDDLRSALSRLRPDAERIEAHMLRNFRKYAHHEAAPGDSVWAWLAVGQHHGLPTRLLDWTYSPFVAAHFATEDLDAYAHDGIVWCVDYVKTNRLLPQRLRRILLDEGSDAFTAEMLDRAARTLEEFDALATDEFVAFFEPPSLDNRIVNQYALFSLMSRAQASLDCWLREHPDSVRRVIIPAELKWEVRDKLDQANVSERVLFPGLDGLSRWLRRYYEPRGRLAGSTGAMASGPPGSRPEPIDVSKEPEG